MNPNFVVTRTRLDQLRQQLDDPDLELPQFDFEIQQIIFQTAQIVADITNKLPADDRDLTTQINNFICTLLNRFEANAKQLQQTKDDLHIFQDSYDTSQWYLAKEQQEVRKLRDIINHFPNFKMPTTDNTTSQEEQYENVPPILQIAKLEAVNQIPFYSGDNALVHIGLHLGNIETYSQISNWNDHMKINIAKARSVGKASDIFHTDPTFQNVATWAEFKHKTLQRFSPPEPLPNLMQSLINCSQKPNEKIDDYIHRFNRTISKIYTKAADPNQQQLFDQRDEPAKLTFFINGLQPDLRNCIIIAQPKTLNAAFELTRQYAPNIITTHISPDIQAATIAPQITDLDDKIHTALKQAEWLRNNSDDYRPPQATDPSPAQFPAILPKYEQTLLKEIQTMEERITQLDNSMKQFSICVAQQNRPQPPTQVTQNRHTQTAVTPYRPKTFNNDSMRRPFNRPDVHNKLDRLIQLFENLTRVSPRHVPPKFLSNRQTNPRFNQPKRLLKCYNCGKMGTHIAKECRSARNPYANQRPTNLPALEWHPTEQQQKPLN